MELIRAAESDYEEVLALYRRAADLMQREGSTQWHWGVYPTDEMILEDIRMGRQYIQRADGVIAAVVSITDQSEPEYDAVPWTGGMYPVYFHRLAVDPQMQGAGIAGGVLDDLMQVLRGMGYDCVRCDTSMRNRRALRLYEKMGLRPCGHLRWPDSEEDFMAFDKALRRETPIWPIRMTPAFRGGKLTPWGGEKLRTVYGKNIPENPTGESLEVSCIPGLESRDPMGRTLPEIIERFGKKMTGSYADRPFPLLLKLIDARDKLSVQVHPQDSYAMTREGGKLGKTEAWLIMEVPEEGGELVYGIRPGTSREELRAACEKGSAVEPLLRRVRVRKGDVCYIPAGCVHAIGEGIMLYEIQQSSDLTYRFYDWDRTDAQGNRRELHLEKGLDVVELKNVPRAVHVEVARGCKRILNEKYFTLDILRPEGALPLPQINDFGMITALEGALTLWWQSGSMELKPGETAFIPACSPELTLRGIGYAALSMPGGKQKTRNE